MSVKNDNSLSDQVEEVRQAFWKHCEAMGVYGAPCYVEDVFADHVVAEVGDKYFSVAYSKSPEGEIVFVSRDQWQPVEETWKPASKSAGSVVSFGDAVKVISETADEMKISGTLVRFSDAAHPDKSAQKDFFTAATRYGLKPGERKSVPVFFNHGHPLKTADGHMVEVRDEIGEGEIYLGDNGVLIDAILWTRKQYEKAIASQIKSMGWSSGALNHVVDRQPAANGAHEIKRWIIGEGSITPAPAEPLNAVIALKSLVSTIPLNLSDLSPENDGVKTAGDAVNAPTPGALSQSNQKEPTMEYTPEELKAMLADVAKQASEEAVKSFVASTPATNAGGLSVTVAEGDRPFRSIAEQCKAVKDFTLSMGRVMDPRLARIEAATKAALGGSEGSPTDGGLLLDPTLVSEVMKPIHSEGPFAPRVRRLPVGTNSNSGWINGVDETSRATGSRWGGIRGYRLAEAGPLVASKPKFRRIQWELKKYGALVYGTDELLNDAAQFSAIVNQGVREEISFMLNDDIFEGIGVAGPQGIMNSPALITADRDTATKVLHADIINMWQRMDSRSKANAAWYINSEVQPQLDQLYFTGTTSVMSPYVGYRPDGVMTLMGKPVIETEFNNALNTTGDILLADMSAYLMWEKAGIEEATSIHLQFLTDETAFRFIYRCDGQSSLAAPLTPFKGTLTKGPFVVLKSAS